MTKFIMFVFAVICYVNATPIPDNEEQDGFSQFSQMSQMPHMPKFQMPQMPNIPMPQKPMSPEDVAKMNSGGNGNFHGVASSISSHTQYVDGKPVTKYQGETVVNDNGKVKKETFGN